MMHCVQCSKELIAPERSEYWSDGHACHVWHCPKCSACFGSLVFFPTETEFNEGYRDRGNHFPVTFSGAAGRHAQNARPCGVKSSSGWYREHSS